MMHLSIELLWMHEIKVENREVETPGLVARVCCTPALVLTAAVGMASTSAVRIYAPPSVGLQLRWEVCD
jgi:hypothetical protein